MGGTVGGAIRPGRFEEKLRPAMQYACGETLVCDSLEIAKLICYERNEKVKGTPTPDDSRVG